MAESKSAKKNKKRRAAQQKLKSAGESKGFEIIEDITTTPVVKASPPPPPLDPVSDLKRQIEEAKAAKDHEKAQDLRQKLWVLQDTVVLGKAGPGAPEVDIKDMLATAKPTTAASEACEKRTEGAGTSTDGPTEKKLNKLRKKLAQIEMLKQRRDAGESLEANQIVKMESEADLLEEISILENLLTGIQLK